MDAKRIARVILRSNGIVHIAFRDIRSIYATPRNILELFTDPIDFIESGSHAYEESTTIINRTRTTLESILGLTLAYINSDKQMVCIFPELFSFVINNASDPELNNKHLNMHSFLYEEVLADEKSYLLRYFLEFTNTIRSNFSIKKNLNLSEDMQHEIIREILSAIFTEDLPKVSKAVSLDAQIHEENKSLIIDSNVEMVPLSEYATYHKLDPATVRRYIKLKFIKNCYKDSQNRYFINKYEKPNVVDKRAGRKRKPTSEPKNYKRSMSGSAAEVEAHIKKLSLFTDSVAPFIHSYAELDYYQKRSYHEICWDGRSALIIDVNPDYRSSKTGVTNRELMRQGKPPVVPDRNREDYPYHIHHIGQHSTSPFCILPSYDHNSVETPFFHQGKPDKELHGPEFELQKSRFWKRYIEEYDKAGTFPKIPYLNSKHKKDKR